MKLNSLLFGVAITLLLPLLGSCGDGDSSTKKKASCSTASFAASSMPASGTFQANGNIMTVTVNGSLCGPAKYQYANEICTSVTLCNPSNPSSCQTISNILLDTGSFGLRIFGSAISVSLTPAMSGNQTLAECVQYGDGSTQWGQVNYAYIQLGNEPAVYAAMQVINSTYGTPAGVCSPSQSTPDTDPQQAGFNGILGVGLFAQDCGSTCKNSASNGQYFTCNGGDCSCGATVELGAQVQNPVSLLPTDNNGVVLVLPSVASATGTTQVTGNLYLGIGTRTNNTVTALSSGGVTTFRTDSSGNIKSIFSPYSSSSMTAFVDSGSNGYFFPAPSDGSLTDCSVAHGSNWKGFNCPASNTAYSATVLGPTGTPTTTVNFSIGNAYNLLNSSNSVFNNLGVNVTNALPGSSALFDWGLPFFFGKQVYVGIQGTTSSLATGPYYAF